jgi:hypothetical protein
MIKNMVVIFTVIFVSWWFMDEEEMRNFWVKIMGVILLSCWLYMEIIYMG